MAKLDTLQNKVVWITGASSGLGKALAGIGFTRRKTDFDLASF